MSTSAVVNVNDPRVQYSGDWSNGESNLHTTEYGAEVRFTFIGTSIAVYGMIMDETTGTAPPMSNFTIDDMPPVTFIEPAEGTPFDDVRFYLSPVLPNGEHTLIVTNANTGMLWIDYFTLSTLIDSITTSETTMAPPSTTSTMGSTSAAPPSETVPGAIILSTSTTLPFTPSTSVFVVPSSPVPISFIASAPSSQQSSYTTSLSTSASGTPSTSTLSSSITSLASASSSSSSSRHTSSSLAKSTGISTSANSDTGGNSGGLSTVAFAAIAAASAFVAAIAAAGLIMYCRNRQKRRRALAPNIIFPTDAHFSDFMWSRDPSLPVVYEDDLAPSEGDYRQVELHGSRSKAGIPSRDDDVYSEHTSWIGSHYPASEYQAVPR